MNEEKEFPERKPLRLHHFDYSQSGAYFITICTKDRKNILSKIVGGDVLDAPKTILSHRGKIADGYIQSLSGFYDNITVEQYVIMPNHIHMILIVSSGGASRTSPPTKQHSTVSRFVSTFKRFCNKDYGENLWQRGFHDHIIRNVDDYNEIYRYICENPRRWELDKLYSEK